MSDQTPGPGSENTESGVESSDAVLGRRRLLKAAAIGAPVVLTLKSGSGWATSSLCDTRTIPLGHFSKDSLTLPSDLVPPNSTNPSVQALRDPANYNGNTIKSLEGTPYQTRLLDLWSNNNARTDVYHSCLVSVLGL